MPEKAEWCGDNAIVLSWGGKVVVVGPGGDSLRYVAGYTSLGLAEWCWLMCSYDYSPSAVLVGELDGLRIISSGTCEFLQKVPGQYPCTYRSSSRKLTAQDSSLAVFSPGSSHPASVLYDALEHFDQKSPKADESIRSIRPDLAGAVDTCIEAAGPEVDSHWQKRLLKVGTHPSSHRLNWNIALTRGRRRNLDVRSWTCTIPASSSRWAKLSKSSTQ